MAEQGHGNHWECVTNLDDLVKKQLPNILQNGQLEDKEEVNAIFFDDGIQSTEILFSIAAEGNFSALALIVTSRDKTSNQFVSGFPFVRDSTKLELKIVEIKEWDNKYEAVIVAETAGEHTVSFFDTKYYKNKDNYKIGKIYTFYIAALSYNVEILKEKSFSFEGQKAVDWLAKIGKQPTFDAMGNIEPVVFDLSNLVTYLPRTEYPDDAEFQSPINGIETVRAFDDEFYKLNITIFRDPDICIDLYVKTSFFEQKPQIDEPLRGVLWMQGYLKEETISQSKLTYKKTEGKEVEKQQESKPSLFLDANGEPQILKHNCLPERLGQEMTHEERHKFAVELLADLYTKAGMTMVNINRNYDGKFPNLVMKSKNGQLYYVVIETTCYPDTAESLYSCDFSEMKEYAKEHNATPTFAGMSFLNINRDMNDCKMICGDEYIVAFKGLEKI